MDCTESGAYHRRDQHPDVPIRAAVERILRTIRRHALLHWRRTTFAGRLGFMTFEPGTGAAAPPAPSKSLWSGRIRLSRRRGGCEIFATRLSPKRIECDHLWTRRPRDGDGRPQCYRNVDSFYVRVLSGGDGPLIASALRFSTNAASTTGSIYVATSAFEAILPDGKISSFAASMKRPSRKPDRRGSRKPLRQLRAADVRQAR